MSKMILQSVDPNKRLYGFARTNSRTKFRSTNTTRERKERNKKINQTKLEFRKNRAFYLLFGDSYNGNNYASFLSPFHLNQYFHTSGDVNKSFWYIQKKYKDISKLITIWKDGYRDIIWSKIMVLTNADFDQEVCDFLLVHHEDILAAALLKLFVNLSNYVPTNRSSFYTYVVNTLPYDYSHAFLSLYIDDVKYQQCKSKESSYDLEQEEYDYNFDLSIRFRLLKQCPWDIELRE